MPKQCLALEGSRTLLQQTFDRLGLPANRVLVCTGAAMEGEVRRQMPDVPADQILVEPSGRNTAPAIAWATREVAWRGGQYMVVLPSDHRVVDVDAFRMCVSMALSASTLGRLVLLGQRATRPETGFGWIEARDSGCVSVVSAFVEKPPLDRAVALMKRGALWNGGMFVWRVDAISRAFEEHLPELWQAEKWTDMTAISIDHGILEKEEHLTVVRCDFGWADLGSWGAMTEVFPDHSLGVARVRDGVALDGGAHIVDAPSKRVFTLGVSDLIIVEIGETLMICARSHAQRVPELRARAEAMGALKAS